MAITRIPAMTSLDPEAQGAGFVKDGAGQSAVNVMYSQYTDKTGYATQRPPIVVYADPPNTLQHQPRGVYYWEAAKTLLAVDFSKVYVGAYASSLGTIGDGPDPVFFIEVSETELLINNPQNNELWLCTNSGGSVTMAAYTNAQADLFNEGLAGGGVTLDGYVFLMSKKGKIYNSPIGDLGSAWNPLDFISCLRVVDDGVFLTKQQENIVAFGTSSIEFFYDAGQPTGSPLKRRDDIVYNVGAVDYKAIHNNGEHIFWVGSSALGSMGFYKLQDFQKEYVSNDSIDRWLNDTLFSDNRSVIVSGGTIGQHYNVYVTSVSREDWFNEVEVYSPIYTAVYDHSIRTWIGSYETNLYFDMLAPNDERGAFGVVSVAERFGMDLIGQTIQFFDGKLGIFSTSDVIQDGILIGAYATSDGGFESEREYCYDQDGYVEATGVTGEVPINFQLTTQEWDGDTYTNKFLHRFAVVGKSRPTSENQEPFYISWTDDAYNTFSEPRELSSLMDRKLTRLGKFKRRAFRIEYAGKDSIRIEAFELDTRRAGYA
jgi:hypothetical protein